MNNGRVALAGLINVEITVPMVGFPIQPHVTDRAHGVRARPAGVACNSAAAFAALGRPFRWTAVAGTDAIGAVAREFALSLPGQVRFVDVAESPITVVLTDADGDTAMFSDPKDAVSVAFDADLSECAALVPTNIRPNYVTVSKAENAGIPVFVDIQGARAIDDEHNAPFCAAAHAAMASHRNLDDRPEQWARALSRRWGIEIVVVGLGADGALVCTDRGRKVEHFATRPGPIASTVGAGDALWACFVDASLNGLDPPAAVRRAVDFAGLKIRTAGGAVGHPSAAELDALTGQPVRP